MNFSGTHRFVLSMSLLAALFCRAGAGIAQDIPSEYSVRAAMVFNFLKFTEFPPEILANAQRIRLCFAVADLRQAEALGALAGRKVGGRELAIVRLTGKDDDCQVVYVDTRQRWNTLEEQHFPRRVLTISAYSGFVREGGIIEIALQEDGTRFEINLAEGRRAGFHFAPQLLRLARRVHE
jgi:hypothetical protein